MSLTTWDALIPAVAPWVADCPGLVQIDALRKAAHAFCVETSAWQVINDPQSGQAEVADYDLDAPSGTLVAHLLAVSYNGVPLEPKTPAQLDWIIVNWSASVGTPAYYFRKADESVTLVPMPATDLDDAIVTRIAVAPHPLTGTGVDSIVTDKYYDAIAAGALARLLMMPGSWTNPKLAQIKQVEFTVGMNNARAAATVANSSAQLRVRGRRFI